MSKTRPTPPLSILMPIYNVDQYLRQSLSSVCDQTLKDLEIICINDGSTDSSLSIIKEFMAKDPRIILINKKNSGYGDSMNQGLKKAKGEYIGIVEPDDWVEKDTFSTLYTLAKIHDVDVVRSNYYHNKAGKDHKLYAVSQDDVGRVVDPRTHTHVFHQSPAIWSAIYRREFLLNNKIDFLPTPGASYQDTGFGYKVWATTHRAYFTPEAFLHYRIDNESSSVNSPGKVYNVCVEYAEIERYLKERDFWSELAPLVFATKLNTYEWNCLRLSHKLLPEFIDRVKEEYIVADKEGELIEEYYLGPKEWHFAKLLASGDTRACLSFIRREKLSIKCKSIIKKVLHTLLPVFAKQVELSENLRELMIVGDVTLERHKLLMSVKEDAHEKN